MKRAFCSEHFRQGIPPQAFLSSLASLTYKYINRIFEHSVYGRFTGLERGDTILVCSDGVIDNIGDVCVASLVKSAYDNKQSPDELCKHIVREALSAAAKGGKPDDTTCVAGYVWED